MKQPALVGVRKCVLRTAKHGRAGHTPHTRRTQSHEHACVQALCPQRRQGVPAPWAVASVSHGGQRASILRTFATDAAGELDVLGHDGHALGVDRAQVGVLEDANQVGLGSLLQGDDGRRLEAQVEHEVWQSEANTESADLQVGRSQVRMAASHPARSRGPSAGRAACGSAARSSSGSVGSL
eukprot:scaffold3005_cov63-Phaeocystis_antarctica.AAC.3